MYNHKWIKTCNPNYDGTISNNKVPAHVITKRAHKHRIENSMHGQK